MKVNPRVFFDIDIDGQRIGRVIFELFADEVPKTAENFRSLCTGERGISKEINVPLHYRGSIFHRVIKGFMCQAGDMQSRNGTGGCSIYGGTFADESFTRKHTTEGLLSMANRGPNTNSSQFFITTRPTPHLDGKHVVFGRVVHGFDVVQQVENESVDDRDRPLRTVMIANCGELELRLPPQQAPHGSGSEGESDVSSDDDSEEDRRRSKKRKHKKKSSKKDKKKKSKKRRRRSSSVDSDDEEDDRSRRHRRHRRKHRRRSVSRSPSPSRSRSRSRTPVKQTAEVDHLPPSASPHSKPRSKSPAAADQSLSPSRSKSPSRSRSPPSRSNRGYYDRDAPDADDDREEHEKPDWERTRRFLDDPDVNFKGRGRKKYRPKAAGMRAWN
ncbi:hypothetical protein DM01DRAFT_1322532 [Hesseltinella vesiculosa]|uniref:peptidylprolyl isomerase n=1 Tax=Hesseltinella vesiculosa TaxID=101127 RepID=A0A1X2GH28_9FUNG|nr:hypothetical protein DM01DRAFT_1322532 [Hesseltinella vesiculosa]